MSDLCNSTDAVERAFTERFEREPTIVAWAPGRVNVIGEHTDYTGGLAMPAAIDRRVVLAMAPRDDETVRVQSSHFSEESVFVVNADPRALHGWTRYVGGLVSVFSERFGRVPGFDAVLHSDVPMGSGLSSSAALEVALANGLREMLGVRLDDLELTRMCQRVENEHLGVPSGLLDQLASQLAREGHFLVLDLRDLTHRHVSIDLDGWSLVLLDSCLRRDLAGSAYEARVHECAAGLARLKADHGIAHVRDLPLELLSRYPGEVWARRLRHVVEENERVRSMETMLASRQMERAAELLSFSHASLRDLYEVSRPEMDLLQELAVGWTGCAGARMVGGGFGGCCLAMVEEARIEGFAESILAEYEASTGVTGRAWEVGPAAGAGVRAR